jgi:hypothetical protein
MAPLLSRLGYGRGGFGFGRLSGGGEIPFSVTGGDVDGLQPGNGYTYHTFTTPGTLTVTGTGNVEVLVVAGGGRGLGGGGGAGGLIYRLSYPLLSGSYPITVGPGGSGTQPTPQGTAGGNGSNSIFDTLTASGGGGGGQPSTPGVSDGVAGGSGGGAGGWAGGIARVGGAGNVPPTTPPQGNPGGSANANGPVYGSGGGGGAGGAGTPGTSTTQGPGGVGLQYPQFTGTLIGVPTLSPLSGYFAGGGGGGGGGSGATATGGLGGGGNTGVAGVTNSGGGGGSDGIAGGAGIVIIRYLA